MGDLWSDGLLGDIWANHLPPDPGVMHMLEPKTKEQEDRDQSSKEDTGKLTVFESGAVRCADADSERYDLITPIGLRRLARVYAKGAQRYGARNWEKGIPASNLINHALRHITLYLLGDTSEDHVVHAAWNLLAVAHFEETDPSLIDIPTRKPAPKKDIQA